MLRGDNTGAMFLFNPTAREINVSLPLSGDGDASLGFTCAGSTVPVLVRQLASSERTVKAAYNLDVLDCTDVLHLTLPPTSARVVEFEQWKSSATPLLLGGPYSKAVVAAGTLTVSGVQGECGTPAKLVVVLPQGAPNVTRVVVNTQEMYVFSHVQLHGMPTVVIQASWTGVRFRRAQEVSSSSVRRRKWSGAFSVPQSAIDQLKARNVSYPIIYSTDPLDTDDANLPWLAPGRLLIFVKYQRPIDDTLNITADIDGRPIMIRKAYNTIVRNPGHFIGHWADVTPFVEPGKQQTLSLQLPAQQPVPDGVFFDNVETLFTDKLATGR
jgi:hypothetical protein